MTFLHSSSRRPTPLRDIDYDHEIRLEDHTQPISPANKTHSRSQSDNSPVSRPSSLAVSDSSSRRHSDAPLRPKRSLRGEVTRWKYSKYQKTPDADTDADAGAGKNTDGVFDDGAAGPVDGNTQAEGEEPPQAEDPEARGRTRDSKISKKSKPKSPESAIDILYENQRGVILCGLALFSSNALGGLDPSPWTNIANKTSATNITNAQVPDPSWEWAWKDWSINHTDDVDEDGWQYAFAYGKHWRWHSASSCNSFVRRRAWIRKRVKRSSGYLVQEGHMLNEDYFTIHPVQDTRSRSRLSTPTAAGKRARYSVLALAKRELEENVEREDIRDITSLMRVLRFARIDREKTEAVENFIEHGEDELYYLRERMHEIMGHFIFQASRRLLLSHLIKIFDEASAQERQVLEKEGRDPSKKRRLENLEEAVKAADGEVKRLEFWSDVKDMASKGEIKGAVDKNQGWNQEWAGLDNSGPHDVLVGINDCIEDDPGRGENRKGIQRDNNIHNKSGTGNGTGPRKGKGVLKEQN